MPLEYNRQTANGIIRCYYHVIKSHVPVSFLGYVAPVGYILPSSRWRAVVEQSSTGPGGLIHRQEFGSYGTQLVGDSLARRLDVRLQEKTIFLCNGNVRNDVT